LLIVTTGFTSQPFITALILANVMAKQPISEAKLLRALLPAGEIALTSSMSKLVSLKNIPKLWKKHFFVRLVLPTPCESNLTLLFQESSHQRLKLRHAA